jgi:hypothetical protein
VALLTKRLIDYGTNTNQVHLGIVPDSNGSVKVALTDDEQWISGLKVFGEIVTSPNSPATLEEIENNNEFVTFEQLDGYEEERRGDFAPPVVMTIPGVIAAPTERPINIIDRETGTLIGVIPPSDSQDPDDYYVPPTTPPKITIEPLPGNPGQYTIPNVGPGGIQIVDGHLIIIHR